MATINNLIAPEGLGDASPEDVAEGVTFTSNSGIRQTGTASKGGDGTLEGVETTFNTDGSITEIYESGKMVTTTFPTGNQVVETTVESGTTTIKTTTISEDESNLIEIITEGDKTITRTTVFNTDGSISQILS